MEVSGAFRFISISPSRTPKRQLQSTTTRHQPTQTQQATLSSNTMLLWRRTTVNTQRRNLKNQKSLKKRAIYTSRVSQCWINVSLDNKFEQSAEMYAEAILCKISPSKKSIIYCNRALAQLKLENYGIALVDAVESAKLDPTNVKSYYRRA